MDASGSIRNAWNLLIREIILLKYQRKRRIKETSYEN